MRVLLYFLLFSCAVTAAPQPAATTWQLRVSTNRRFLQYADGRPFFWMGETAWLMPQRLNRDEAAFYLKSCHDAGYNVVQVQVLNAIPSYNAYGQPSHDTQQRLLTTGAYTYWDHLDYIVSEAERNDIYVAMVCVWGSVVKSGKMDVTQARDSGAFLGRRYGRCPNIVWVIGGDIQGDVKPEVWNALATTIRQHDSRQHLMTFHPRGRTTSAHWWSQAPWIDFHAFQSGHRRYGQRMGDKTYPIPDNSEEDNWQYVDSVWAYTPQKPVIDAEPSYELIPKGLHNPDEQRWQASDVRRYAYWSVFAGSCGHTYGNNAIMQFWREGLTPAYGADVPWTVALHAPGFHQMKHLKRLMLAFPYFERVADQSVVRNNGTRYDRLVATRGTDYLLVYNYTGRDMTVDLRKISGQKKRVWWMDAATGRLAFLGEYGGDRTYTFRPQHTEERGIEDGVLIVVDATKSYIETVQAG